MNKEKSSKREKPVNIENNSASYFPILTVIISICTFIKKLKKDLTWSDKWVVLNHDHLTKNQLYGLEIIFSEVGNGVMIWNKFVKQPH